MQTPDGQVYGPARWTEIETWAAEGRVAADCQLAQRREGPWQSAAERFPGLRPAPRMTDTPAPPTKPPPPAAAAHSWTNYSQSSAVAPSPAPASYVNPHRGGLILVLGLLGFVISCPIFSFLAWVMGSHDLNEMRAGRMDRSGEGLTQVGQILGIILSILWILGLLGVSFMVLVAAIAGR